MENQRLNPCSRCWRRTAESCWTTAGFSAATDNVTRSLDLVYEIAKRLHGDREDLIQKAVGWTLREAGKTDLARLERYLRANGARIPRLTLRYAIERFPPAKRAALLKETRRGK